MLRHRGRASAGWWRGVWVCYRDFWLALLRPLQNSVWKRKPTLELGLADLLPAT